MYVIQYDYRTGNSFGLQDIYNELLEEFSWENLEIVKENLKRIEEHYRWYREVEENGSQYKKRFNPEPKPPKWWDCEATSTCVHNLINIKLDSKREKQFWPPWCGYFERLYAARIGLIGIKNEMEITI